MFNFSASYFVSLLVSLPGILIAITFHEMAHAYAADAMGDPTPRREGRLSLNPLHHLDPIGFLCMIFFRFGWAKPVPINPSNFENRRKGIIVVSLAGCLTNLLLGFIGVAAYMAVLPLNNELLDQILEYIFVYNIMFAVFNLIPIPPLDGSQILGEFLPYNARMRYASFSRYGFIILFILIVTGLLSYIISPPISGLITLFTKIWNPVIQFFWS